MTQPLVLHAAEETLEAVHTRRHAAYPAYKPSGVEWLGEVPEHWKYMPIKWIVETPMTDGPHETPEWVDEGIPFVSAEGVFDGRVHLDRSRGMITPELHREYSKKVRPRRDDIFIVKSGATTGKVGYVDFDDEFNIWSPLALVRCDRKTVLSRYAFYTFVEASFQRQIELFWSYGTQPNIGMRNLEDLDIAVPPLREQQAIARYLDGQTQKIDDLIEAKRSLLELLKEKRQAVITHAVTRGLDPAAKLKPSGVEWLGDVPEHWDVKRLKHLGRIRYGLGEPPEYVDNGLPFIRATDIYRGKINVNEVRRVNPSDVPWSRNPQLQDKDILIVRSGAYTGDSAIVTKDIAGSIAGYDMVMSVTKAKPDYIAYSLLGKHLLEGQIYLSKLRAAQPHLNAEELGNCLVAIPSEAEQSAIVNHVREETQKIDDLESVVREAIETLELLRAGIISAAVTGKIDVREEGV